MLFDIRPKSSRNELYGREKELDQLLDSLRSETPLVVLLGVRRVGKTSLMKTALSELDTPYLYLDMRRLEEEGYSKVVLYGILADEMNKLNSRQMRVTETLKLVRGVQIAGSGFELDWSQKTPLLSTFFESLDQLMKKRKTSLIVAVDEAQLLKNMVGGKGKLDFRSLIAYAYDNLPRIKFLLTGSEVGLLMDFIGLENPKSALYGRDREEILLGRFDRAKSIGFLESGFSERGMTADPEILSHAVDSLDGIVGWLTLYGSMSSRLKRVSRDAIQQVLDTAKETVKIELDPIFRRSRYYKLVLISLSSGGGAHWSKIKRDISSWIKRPVSDTQVSNTLHTLCQLSILDYNNELYSIIDPRVAEFAKDLSNP